MQLKDEDPVSEPPPSASHLDFLDSHPFVRQVVCDKVYGCIVGSALGDTIGLYTEFLPKHQCDMIYRTGKFSLVDPITEIYPDSHRNRFEKCAWTDDTDQALLILLSYLHHHSDVDVLATLPQDFASRLRIWVDQGLRALDRLPCGIGNLVGSVVCHKSYLSNPTGRAIDRWVKTSRHVAPNGSLMRTHPLGIICVGLSEEEAWKLTAEVGMTTHVDPRCTVSCCVSVGLIRGMLRGEVSNEQDVNSTIERAYDWVFSQPHLMNPGLDPDLTEFEIKRLLERREFERHVYAADMEHLMLDSRAEMGYVYKCLGSAILTLRLGIRATKDASVVSHSLFETLITELIMEGGDSDTNAAAAGALLGVWAGYCSLPAHWSDGLAHKDWLMSKIGRLLKSTGIQEGEVSEEVDEAPDGGKRLMDRSELEKRDRNMLEMLMFKDKARRDQQEMERRKTQTKGLSTWFKK
ncbi:ADP-ribosylglycohydrolase [Polyplosphaeria fusca]|uniref:ADP-ribosylglycohydrolase n=1 Tax=Polyplosphaeria fusca TaxID=682080 RepID=A0A9P4V0R9_9PLEO|nr:ADP-ribosylglycohydrolase [Polyplosphaeria fusca]